MYKYWHKCWLMVVVVVGLLTLISGCSGSTAPTDGGTDAGTDGDAGPSMTSPTRINVTGGGGTTSSQNYKARIHIGAPQPYGATEGSNKRVLTGPKPSP